jgi:hypothetical protein
LIVPDEDRAAQIHAAVSDATRTYLAQRRIRVDPFTRKHFSFRGALRINRRALGKDLLRTPINVLWSIPYLLVRGGAALGRKLRLDFFARQIERLPPGFKTDVEREIEWLIYSEWLELPFSQEGRCCTRDALLETILAHPIIGQLLIPELIRLDNLAHQQNFRQRLEEYLATYANSRTAAADLSGSLLGLAAGAAAFQQFTPGAIAIGAATSTVLANHLAIGNFMLGPSLGSLYYGLFPASVSAGLLATTTGSLIVALSILTAGAGVITDPLQQAMGLHKRKLLKLLDALKDELDGQGNGYRLHDAYVARIFDLWDLLQIATRAH